MKECPMCGENMRLLERQYSDQLPGQGELSVRMVREWNCPECDYFEEAEAGEE